MLCSGRPVASPIVVAVAVDGVPSVAVEQL